MRWRLSKGHRPFRYLAPIKLLYPPRHPRFFWHCALHLAPRFRSERPRRGSGRFFSKCPRPLNDLHRRALDRIPELAILVILVAQLTFCCTSFPLPKLRRPPVAHIQTRCIRPVKDMRAKQFFIFARGVRFVLCNMQGPGKSLCPQSPSGRSH